MIGAFWQSIAREMLTAGSILAAFLLAIIIVRLFWVRLLGPLIRRTETELDDTLLLPLRSPVLWGLLLIGVNQSVSSLGFVRANDQVGDILAKALGIAWVLLAVATALRLLNGVVALYIRRAAERPAGGRDISSQMRLAHKAINIVMLALGLLYVLRVAGVDISPLLAGGAIGGLAVALALQDTLSNLFAGFYLTIDKPVSMGDFVKLESGEEGFIEEIGWRNTKIRMWANNVVVIPNAKLAQSHLTNYYLPEQEMSVYVPCGVAYDSDLQRVEDVTIEVAKQVMQQVEGSATDWEPVVRWKEFGDCAITFLTVLRVREFGAQYKLQSEFVKALHRRFQQEDIEIPFPIRTVIMKPAAGGIERASLATEGAAPRPPFGSSAVPEQSQIARPRVPERESPSAEEDGDS